MTEAQHPDGVSQPEVAVPPARVKLPPRETRMPGSIAYIFPPEGLTSDAAKTSELSVAGLNVLVTGSSRGIGAATARRLAYYGANVGVTAREESRDRALAVVDQIKSEGGNAAFLAADLTAHKIGEDPRKQKAVGDLYVDFMEQQFGGIDAFIFNAAVTGDMLLPGLREDDWLRVVNTNVHPLYYALRPVLRHMTRRTYDDPIETDEHGRPVQYYKGGVVVGIDSVSRKTANKGQFAYVMSKGAMHEAFRELGAEGASRGIRTFMVSCGPTDTEILGSLKEEQIQAAKEAMPLLGGNRLITPDEIAYMIHVGMMKPANPMTSALIEMHGGVELVK